MQVKDSKASKNNSSNVSNTGNKTKRLENKVQINQILPKNINSKSPIMNHKNDQKSQEMRNNKIKKRLNTENNINTKDKLKGKKNLKYQTKLSNDKSITKVDSSAKSKISHKFNTGDKKTKKNRTISKKNSNLNEPKKNLFMRANTNYINNQRKENINNIKNKKEESGNNFETKKLLQILASLYPVDNSKCNNLLKTNLSKILELENKIKEIIIQTQDEVEMIKNKGNQNISNDDNEEKYISLEENIEIINKESKTRKVIYELLFGFITQILEQINKLSNNIANQELSQLNNLPNNDNLFMSNNNNASLESHNSLFVSEIQDDLYDRLNNITRSFINNDIDLSAINYKNTGDINFKKNFEDNLFNDDEDYNDYQNLFVGKTKKSMIHPKEILDKIEKEEKKEKKIVHHYSNSHMVFSNYDKLEEKTNKNEDNNNIEQSGKVKKTFHNNNCFIF